jgi:hypothetical protein
LDNPQGAIEKDRASSLDVKETLSNLEWKAFQALEAGVKLDEKLITPAMKVLLRQWQHEGKLYDALREKAVAQVEKNEKVCKISKAALKKLGIESWLDLADKQKEYAKDPAKAKALIFLDDVTRKCRTYPLFA